MIIIKMEVTLFDMVLNKEYKLGQFDDLTIGISPLADVVIPDEKGLAEYVSGFHCILKQLEDDLVVYDKESKNGTFVNGDRVSSKLGTLVQDRDLVSLGPYKFRVHIEYDFKTVLRTPTTSEALKPTEIAK